MEDDDEVDVLGDFCLNLETDLNQYDAGEFPTQNSELLGDYMQHPWLLESSQVWNMPMMDHANEDKNKTLNWENMLHEEKKHFSNSLPMANPPSTTTSAVVASKVSPMWTKDDVASLRKGIGLHNQNWSKVARAVGTKTTLQVKSYIKSHPELITSSSVHISNTPSPPQFINEVEVTNEEPTFHFSMGDIVYEAEVPAVSTEEVIASVAPTKWDLTPTKNSKKTNRSKPKSPTKEIRRVKNPLLVKKAPGRPRKISKDLSVPQLTNCNIIIDDATLTKKPVPILQGEIIRLQRTSELVDSSDSEVDIDCSDDEEERTANKPPTILKETLKLQSSSDDSSVPIKNEIQEAEIIETLAPPLPQPSEPSTKYAQEDKSECESSETDSKNPDVGLMDAEPPQPVFTFPAPLEERTVAFTIITDEEKTIHWDFFEGRPSKTPERYMKIRNSIVQEWRRVKPRYLTKTSVRPSLKNCGDVNCISRVHAYLELTGAINFGCDQVQYNRPLPPVPCHRERMANSSTHFVNNLPLISGLPARVRKKRPHHENGDENGGYTISHDGSQGSSFISNSGSTSPQKQKPKKRTKPQLEEKSPFQLVPCLNFGGEKEAPFSVQLSVEALVVIDLHSHTCTTEIIGLLGGHIYPGSDKSPATLSIEAAQPCRSQATNHQCEMCPISQTEGSEELRSRGLEIVGWYHSHPTFPALPSLRDLNTQNEFQQWFSRQDAPFVGLIVNPFSSSGIKTSMSLKSTIRCITVHDDLPYKHELPVFDCGANELNKVRITLDVLETNLDLCPTLVPLNSKYPYLPTRSEDGILNYAKKALSSIRAHLENVVTGSLMNDIEELAEGFLNRLIARHASRVIVSPVFTSTLPCSDSN
ncbi:histone H2A deubiquitinase MYSM1-like [Daphnia pulex]|uniref:histone H2A deubiquitinase MYSM1-like n=1 Tax=Daphnia pulex TaxID=6669 RepID=UPI001EDE50C9|nr:histone H2A deubiquitinase MYSM1-like [Daphnia pulex]